MKVKQYRKILLLVLMICAAILSAVWNGHSQTAFHTADRIRVVSRRQLCTDFLLFSKDAAVTKDYVIQLEQKLKTALQEASEDTSGCKRKNAVDCYSTKGELTLYSDRASSRREHSVLEEIFSHFIR